MKFIYESLKLIAVCAMVVFVFAAGWFLSPMGVQLIIPDKEVECNKLHSIEEIQVAIGAKVDGKLCKGWGGDPNHSETQRLWDLAYCNQEAAKYFK